MSSVDVRILGPADRALLRNVIAGVFDHPVDEHWCDEFFADPRHHLAVAIDGPIR